MSFTLADVKELIRLLSETDIVELQLDLESEGARLTIRKAGAWVQASTVGTGAAVPGVTAGASPSGQLATPGEPTGYENDQLGRAVASAGNPARGSTLVPSVGAPGGVAATGGIGTAMPAAGSRAISGVEGGRRPADADLRSVAAAGETGRIHATPVAAQAGSVGVGPPEAVTGDRAGAPAMSDGTGGVVQEAQQTPVVAPMVGTFYRGPSPDAPPFVEVGSKVVAGQTLCIIEAMKLMNEITAEAPGRVVAILAQDGEPVEYGQTLLLLEPETRG